MSALNVNLKLKSWNRFRTPNLAVCAELLGQSHSFTHQGRKVTISLPEQPQGDPDCKSDRLRLYSWREAEGKDIIPLEWIIYSVDVSVEIDEEFDLPREILVRNPKAVDILSTGQVTALDRSAEISHDFALKAFEFWVRMMRWSVEQPLIGRDDPDSPESGWGTYLVDSQTKKKVWAGTRSLTVHKRTAVTEVAWREAEANLSKFDHIPIPVDLYFESLYYLHIGDLQRAISDAAVSAETHMRIIVQESIPDCAGAELRRLVDEANIRPIMQRVYGESLLLAGYTGDAKVPSEIHQLFDYRNKILHKGAVDDLTEAKCRKLITAVRNLLWIDN